MIVLPIIPTKYEQTYNELEKGGIADTAIMCEVYQEPNSFVSYDRKIYKLNTILQIANTFPVALMPVRELSLLLDSHHLSYERVKKANLSYPVIISELRDKFIVLDGVHRLAKSIVAGISDIPAKFIRPDLFIGFALPHDHPIYTYDIEHNDVKDLQILLKNKQYEQNCY